ncbi:hypothetical protein LBMAG37_07240 [Anaerolineae bacterium]|nr:hypothetical protein LBMAG37_07240 [Anaerolineae bacterium]
MMFLAIEIWCALASRLRPTLRWTPHKFSKRAAGLQLAARLLALRIQLQPANLKYEPALT